MKKIIFALLILFFITPAQAADNKAYDNILKSRKIRCAYGLWEPVVMRDPNTGEMSGIFVDLMGQIGHALNLEVEWTMEVDWGQIPTVLQSGKVDAHCAGMWSSPRRGTRVAFTKPIFFTPLVTAVRLDDARFDKNLNALNSSEVRLAVGDDDVPEEIALRDFPDAQRAYKPQLSGEEQLIMMVMTQKADATFNEANYIRSFMEKNPDKIKIIHEDKPVRVFGNTIGVNIHEDALLKMFNTTLDNLILSGSIDRIFDKYKDDYDVSFYLYPTKAYETRQ